MYGTIALHEYGVLCRRYTCLYVSALFPKYVRCNSQVSLNKLTNEMRNKWEKLRSEKEIIAYVVVMLS